MATRPRFSPRDSAVRSRRRRHSSLETASPESGRGMSREDAGAPASRVRGMTRLGPAASSIRSRSTAKLGVAKRTVNKAARKSDSRKTAAPPAPGWARRPPGGSIEWRVARRTALGAGAPGHRRRSTHTTKVHIAPSAPSPVVDPDASGTASGTTSTSVICSLSSDTSTDPTLASGSETDDQVRIAVAGTWAEEENLAVPLERHSARCTTTAADRVFDSTRVWIDALDLPL